MRPDPGRGANWVLLAATLGGLGRIRWMPGTFGSLGALPLGWLLWHLPAGAGMVCAAIFALAAVPLAGAAQRLLRQPDPGCIVVDEAAGMLLALTALPPGWLTLALGFAFFRGFDIFKPWPIGWLDRTVKGGLGIVADDLAAGLAANLLVRMVLTALPPP